MSETRHAEGIDSAVKWISYINVEGNQQLQVPQQRHDCLYDK